MEIKNCYVQKNVSTGFRRSIKRTSMLLFALLLLVVTGFSQNYPFPQNYKYPRGHIYTGSNVQSTIQGLYNSWLSKYYVEGLIKGKPGARIKFIQNGESGVNTVSEGIAYGMLIMVYMDNTTNKTQDKFNRLWTYYKENSNGNGVMNWKVNDFTGTVTAGTGNANGATDAELDAAQALLLAHKQWGSSGAVNYLSEAKTLISAIWSTEVNQSQKLLKPGDAFDTYKNPCYFITNAMQLFENVENSEAGWSKNDWTSVITNSYNLMETADNNTTGLVPDWCYADGSLISGIIDSKFESFFGYDAVRIPWRMAQAYCWYGNMADSSHRKAYDIANRITNWVKGKHPDPSGIVDGYFLNGNALSGQPGSFAAWGTSSNACFKGGLSLGSMVSSAHSSYRSSCWSVGSAPDSYGAYYTHTTQLLFMLVLTGNMPNFWDMKPVAVSAETDANGRVVYVDFSKALVSTSDKSGWLVETFADEADLTPTTVAITSLSVSGSRVTLTLTADIAEPYIKVSFTQPGTATIKSLSDNKAADSFTKLAVTNKITNMEPYPILRFTDVIGSMIKVQWSKEIAPASLNATHFTVKVDGVSTPVTGIEIDATDPTITNILINGGVISSAGNVVTLSFAGGSITGTTSSKTAKAFTDAKVQNFYMNVSCYTIDSFNPSTISWSSSGTGSTWSIVDDPVDASSKVGKLVVTTNETYHNGKGKIADFAGLNAALAGGSTILKFRMYVSNPNATKNNVRLRIYDELWETTCPGTCNDWGNHMYNDFTIKGTNAWYDYELDLKNSYSSSIQYDAIVIEPSPEVASAETVYIDDIRFCPQPPTVNFVNGRTSYDGTQIEIRFNTAMKVPTNLSEISVLVGASPVAVTSISAKQGDASFLVLTLATPIASEASVITVSGGSSAGLKSVDGRQAEYFNGTIVNLLGVSITTGWRDDFNSTTDYVTANIGPGTSFDTPAPVENATSPGTYTITGDGASAYAPVTITTYGAGANDSKQVMDLTGREIVQIKYRVPSATSTTLWVRIDVMDKVRGCNSDQMAWVQLPFTAGSTTWQEKTFNLNFYSIYGTPAGDVDRTNIKQVGFYFAQTTSDPPKLFNGKIEFDYISIGSALILTVPVTSINEGAALSATSSATGKIYLVPNGTVPVLSALQDSVFAGHGVVVDATANVAATIATTGLKPGYYLAYAYDPTAGAISAKVGVQINDVTPPTITQFSQGNFAAGSVVTVTVSEDATVYIVPPGTLENDYVTNNVGMMNVQKDVQTAITLDLLDGNGDPLPIGSTYVYVAVDWATPTSNASAQTINPSITIVAPTLTTDVTYPTNANGNLEAGGDILIETNLSVTAYLVPAATSVTTLADLTAATPKVVGTSVLGGSVKYLITLSSTGLPEGNYQLYIVNSGTIVPSVAIPIQVSSVKLTVLTILSQTVSVALGSTTTNTVVYTPSNTTNYTLTPSYSIAGIATVTPTSDGTGSISIKGDAIGTTTVTLTSSDGPTVSFTVNVTCPTIAPTATQIPNVTACQGDVSVPNLTATLSGGGMARWYAAASGGTAIIESNAFAHGVTSATAGVTTFYASQYASGCESTSRLAVTVTVTAKPTPVITAAGPFCKDDAAVTLTATPSGGTWSGAVTSASFNPATATTGNNTVNYSVTVGGCTGSTSSTIVVNAVPVITDLGMPTAMCQNDAAITLASLVSPSTGTFTLAAAPVTQFNPATQTTGNKTLTYSVTTNGCDATQNFTINVKAVPTATMTGLPASMCVGATAINLESYVAVTGGTYSDNLSNVSGTTFTPSNTGTSTITHTVVSGGCTGTATGTIVVNALPVITPVASLCTNDAAVTLSATPIGGTWSGTGVTGSSFNPATAGVGTHTITYTNGCSVTSSVTVNTATSPTVANVSVQVNGTPAAFVATGVTGTVTWYDNVALTTPLSTGASYTSTKSTATEGTVYTYYVTNTENGCTSAPTIVTLTVSSCGVAAPTGVSAPVVCQGSTIPALTATATGTLKWYSATDELLASGATFDPSTYVTGTGVTTFKVSQTDGCEGTKASTTVTVNSLPAAPTVTSAEICFGDAAKAVTAVGTNVRWENAARVQIGTGDSYTSTETAVGSYTYYAVSVSAQSCNSAQVAATYNIIAKPAAPTVNSVSACVGSVISPLTVSGSNVKWYADNVTSTVLATGASYTSTETGAGTYTYYASQTSGSCESTRASGTLTINAKPAVSITGDATACIDGAAVSLTTSPTGGTITGSTGITGTTLNPAVAGSGVKTLTYSYTDLNGCSNTASHTITIYQTPVPTASDASMIVDGTIPALVVSGGTAYTWYDATGVTQLATTASYTPTVDITTAAVHTFLVTNTANGCESDPVTVKLTITSCATATPTVSGATICLGQTIPAVTATGTSIIWYNEAGTQVGTGASYTPTGITAAGTYNYYATQTISCEGAKAKAVLQVNALPVVSTNPIADVCSNGSPVTLATYGNPSGGTWSGSGVTTGTFTPSSSLAGNVTLTYSYTDANSCINTATATFAVTHVLPPTITNSPVIAEINVTPTPFVATGTSVKWYSDASLLSNVGNGLTYGAPAKSVNGDYNYYATQTVNGCTSAAATAVLTVSSCTTPLPTLIVNGTICVGETIPALSATGTSLTWYDATNTVVATGVNSYTPTVSNATDGIYTYGVSQNTGCEGAKAQVTLTVNALPTVTFSAVPALCSTDAPISLASYVSPSGGTYSGAVSSANFDPAVLGVGSQAVTYTYNNGTCSNTASRSISVNNCSVQIESITVTATSIPVGLNGTAKINYSIYPQSAASNGVEFVVTDGTKISVDADGTIHGLALGSTTVVVRATDGSNVTSQPITVTVSDVVVPISSVTFNVPNITLNDNSQTSDVSTTIVLDPINASVQSISYSSTDATLVSVDPSGVITTHPISGLATQLTAKIIVTVKTMDGTEKSGFLDIIVNKTVVNVNITSITIPSTLTVAVGGTKQATATILPLVPTDPTYTWSVSSGTAGTISASGLITATGTVGETFTIIATANDPGQVVSNTCTVTVIAQEVPITDVAASISKTEIVVGETITLNLALTPLNTTQTNFNVAATPNGVVTIVKISDTQYEITGASGGNVTISVQNADNTLIYDNISLSVTQLVTDITFSAVADMTVGQSTTISAVVSPSTASNKNLIWSSSDETVATVSSTGTVTAIKEGTVTITASSTDDSNISETATINVTSVPVASIVPSFNSIEVEVGKSTALSYTVNPSNATYKEVIFSSSDNSIVTVDANGVITGVSFDPNTFEGNATITITSVTYPSISATVYVTVIPVQADKSELSALLDIAFGIYIELSTDPDLFAEKIGSNVGQIPLDTWTHFEDVIFDSEVVMSDEFATQVEVDTASNILARAILSMGYTIPGVSVEELSSASVKVYPVPFENEIKIDASVEIVSVRIISSANAIVLDKNVASDKVVLQTSDLVQGTYFIQVITADKIITKPAIKK